MNILICSQQGEVQVEEVTKKINQAGFNCVLFERFRKDQLITYFYNKKQRAMLKIGHEEYSLDSHTFPVVWYRPKPIIYSELPGEQGDIAGRFCANEWRCILRSLDVFLGYSKWVNPIWNGYRAEIKPYQLHVAREVGLPIPETVISNNADHVLTLFGDNRVIYKTINSFLSSTGAIYTNEVEHNDVANRRAEIAMAPGIFQKYINKKYELRITIVGEKLFIAKINSQLREDCIDWRRNPNENSYEMSEIRPETRDKLLRFHKLLGLNYAAYDFIVDSEGQEIFIECNPSGQWLWLENELGLDVSNMMVKELCEPLIGG